MCGKSKFCNKIECYGTDKNGRRSARYITITGDFFEGIKELEEDANFELDVFHKTFFSTKEEEKDSVLIQYQKRSEIAHIERGKEIKRMVNKRNKIEETELEQIRKLADQALNAGQGTRNATLYRNVKKALDLTKGLVYDLFMTSTTLSEAEANKTIKSAIRDIKITEESGFMDFSGNKPKIVEQTICRDTLIRDYRNYFRHIAYDMTVESWYQRDEKYNYWKQINVQEVKQIVDHIVTSSLPKNVGYNLNWLNGVIGLLQTSLSRKFKLPPRGLILFHNGVLDLSTKKFSKASKTYNREYDFINIIPHDYIDVELDYDEIKDFRKFIKQLTGKKQERQILRAFMFAILYGMPELEKFLVLVGTSGSGKGSFIRLCSKLVGQENTSSTNFTRLNSPSSSRFELSSFFRKKLIVIPDSEFLVKDTTLLKSITGEDLLPFELKGKNVNFSFRNEALLVIACNESLQFANSDYAVQRRMVQVNCNFKPEKQDVYLETKLDKELPGIIKWVLGISYGEVIEIISNYNKLNRSNEIKAITDTSPLADWAEENIIRSPSGSEGRCYIGAIRKMRISSSVGGGPEGELRTESYDEIPGCNEKLYPSFFVFCKTRELKPLSIQKFARAFENLLFNCGVTTERGRDSTGKFFTGIKIRDEFDVETPSIFVGQKIDPAVAEKIYYKDDL